MRVLVLTPYPYGTTAGPRSSFELWERVLRAADISLDYAVFETDRLHKILYEHGRMREKVLETARSYVQFLPKVARATDYDAVLVNREATLIGPAIVERWVARLGIPLIYHLDDPLFVPYRSPANGPLSYLKFFGKVAALCRMSRTVIVNSPQISEFASRHSRNVWEIPSVVDAELYTGWEPPAARDGSPVCVGWTGSVTTAQNLQVIRQPLRAIADRPDVSLRFIGAEDFDMPEVSHEAVPWRADTEVAELRSLDIGLVPLPVTPWTPLKFYLKLVQYMALGIPPVATPLGANASVVEHGKTGFLASSTGDWIGILQQLVSDSELRDRVGRRAAEVAHERYTLQANAEKIVAAFRATLG